MIKAASKCGAIIATSVRWLEHPPSVVRGGLVRCMFGLVYDPPTNFVLMCFRSGLRCLSHVRAVHKELADSQSNRPGLHRPRCLIHSGLEFLLAAHVPRDPCTYETSWKDNQLTRRRTGRFGPDLKKRRQILIFLNTAQCLLRQVHISCFSFHN